MRKAGNPGTDTAMSRSSTSSFDDVPALPPLIGDAPGAHNADDVTPGDIAVGVVIGRASEYFDFFVYGIASVLVFPALFFPSLSRLEGTLYSFLIFSFAFVARPLGTMLSMAVQRRWGRGTKLTIALFLLGTATVCIAFLPGYETAGRLSIALLAFNAPKGRRGWYAMLGQLGAPLGFIIAAALFAYLYSSLPVGEFLDWGWRFPFFVAFAINVVALFARLRLVVGQSYADALQARELEPVSVTEVMSNQGTSVFLGAFAALASLALFHLVTVFPLSWISMYSEQSMVDVLNVQMVGAVFAAGAIVISGTLADKVGRRNLLGTMAVLIGVFSLAAPFLLKAGSTGNNIFILAGFILLGLSYGQSSGTVTNNFTSHFRYTGAALSNDLAWLIGAAFAPRVALGLSAKFGLMAVTLYLLSAVVCTLLALRINRVLEQREA